VISLLLIGAGLALLWLAWHRRGTVRSRPVHRAPRRTAPPAPPVRRAVRADVPTALYFYPHATRPGAIYYGISSQPEVRHVRHENDPDDRWWMERSTGEMVIISWHANRPLALAHERAAIRRGALAGEDLANDHHNPIRRPRRAVPRRS